MVYHYLAEYFSSNLPSFFSSPDNVPQIGSGSKVKTAVKTVVELNSDPKSSVAIEIEPVSSKKVLVRFVSFSQSFCEGQIGASSRNSIGSKSLSDSNISKSFNKRVPLFRREEAISLARSPVAPLPSRSDVPLNHTTMAKILPSDSSSIISFSSVTSTREWPTQSVRSESTTGNFLPTSDSESYIVDISELSLHPLRVGRTSTWLPPATSVVENHDLGELRNEEWNLNLRKYVFVAINVSFRVTLFLAGRALVHDATILAPELMRGSPDWTRVANESIILRWF